MARLQLSTPDLRRAFLGGSRNAAEAFAGQVRRRAQELAPVRSGRLRRSIRSTSRLGFRGWTSRVGSDLDYAEFVHDGTRPHLIRPRRARALRFTAGGRVVFARLVRHPGTRPNPFLDRALREVSRREGWDYRRGTGGGR